MDKFPHHLTVIHDFESYRRGDKITDDAECHRVMAGDNAHHVHRTQKEEVFAPAPKKTKSSE